MERFYIQKFSPDQKQIVLSDPESRHALKVLRKRRGDLLELTDGQGYQIWAVLGKTTERQVTVEVQRYLFHSFPPENRIEIGLAIVRPNRMDWAVEKLCELGVERIVPLRCKFGSYPQLKTTHLQRIAISAIKQSGQFYLPEIGSPMDFSEWIDSVTGRSGKKWIAQPDSTGTVSNRPPRSDRSEYQFLAIGPEGGFSGEELESAQKSGFGALDLGGNILRTETAAVVGVTRIKFKG